MTLTTLAVLAVMLKDPPAHYYGLELCREAAVKPGALYPILARLERAGWLRSAWEQKDPAQKLGRPRRRYYHLTGKGEKAASEAVAGERERLFPPKKAGSVRIGNPRKAFG